MKRILSQFFSFGSPEAIGLMILGATIGAVAGGAGGSGSASPAAMCAGLGAVAVPGLVRAPWWSRLARARK